jgi:histidyl-tRNA synthetase
MRTAFEITSGELGAQNAIVGGGRYDGLSELLGGPPAKGIGFASGIERLILALPEEKTAEGGDEPDVYIAYMGEQARQFTFELARRLRRQRIKAVYDFEERKLKKLMAQADKLRAAYALLIGENELSSGRVTLRNMKTGEQVQLDEEEVAKKLAPIK